MSTYYAINADYLNEQSIDRVCDLNIKLNSKCTIGEVIDNLINIGVIVNNNFVNEKTELPVVKPSLWSDEMYDFLNIEKGTLIARTDITKYVSEYIKSNNLTDGKNIIEDEKLKNLLKCDKNLTFFNIQTYISKHFKNN
jgi:hypothetical protein